jgi:hypothetical protein
MNALRSAMSRYTRRIEEDGTWTVFDAFTGRTAEVGSRQTTGMQLRDAEEIVAILNRMHPASDDGSVH